MMAMPFSYGKSVARALRGQGEFPDKWKGSRTIAELTALYDACASASRKRQVFLLVVEKRQRRSTVGRESACALRKLLSVGRH